jgi:hypothetical protein
MFLSSESDTTEVGAQWFFALAAVNRDFEALHGPVGGMHRGAVGVQHGAPAIATSFGFESYGKKRLQPVHDTFTARGSIPGTICGRATRQHTGQDTMLRKWVTMASLFPPTIGAACAPATFSVRSYMGKVMQAPHIRDPSRRVLPGCPPHHVGGAGTQSAATSATDSRAAGMAAAGTAAS